MKERGASAIIVRVILAIALQKSLPKRQLPLLAFPAVVPTRVWQREETIREKRREKEREKRRAHRWTREERLMRGNINHCISRAHLFTHVHVCDSSTMYRARRNDCVRVAQHRVRVRNLSGPRIGSRILSLFCGIARYIFPSRSLVDVISARRNDEIIYR